MLTLNKKLESKTKPKNANMNESESISSSYDVSDYNHCIKKLLDI